MRKFNKAEKAGEAFALQVLSEHFGGEVFTGAAIELKVASLASVVYKSVDDPAFYGATVAMKRDNRKYVILNSNQPMRLRYFTAAHELWHILDIHTMVNDDLDQERAADRFAAALMLPESLVRAIVHSLQQSTEGEMDAREMVIQLADHAAAPYVAVAKRLVELRLTPHPDIADYSEEAWKTIRKERSIADSPLDQPMMLNQFAALEKRTENQVQKGNLTALEASKQLIHTAPALAAEYAEKYSLRRKQLENEEADQEEDHELDRLFEEGE